MLPSLSRVTRFSGTGRSSVVSHQSTECLAASVRVHWGDEHGQLGLLAAHGLGVGLADHLDVAHRILIVLGGGVEVVEPQRLLVDRVVALGAEGRDRLGVVEHVVAAHLVRPVRQPVRVLVIGRAEQDLGAVGGAGGDDHDVAGVHLALAAAGHHHPGHRAAGGIGFQPGHLGPADQRHVLTAEDGPDRDHLGVGLGVHQARVAITPGAADAGAARPVGLVQQDPARRVERVPAALGQAIGDLLEPRLMRDRRPRVLLRPVALGRVLAVIPVHLVQLLGRRVPRLEVVVGQRPGRGDPVDVLDLAEVLGPQPVQGRAVHLGGPADEVVHLGLERLAVPVEPGVLGDVLARHEHRLGVPVVHLAGQEIAPFQQQDPLARIGQGVRQRPAPGSGPDDDHVIVLAHAPTIAA